MNKQKKQQIIFLESFPEVMIYKLARVFKKKGYKCISVRLLTFDKKSEAFYKDAFDQIISFDLSFTKMNLKNIHNVLLLFLRKTPSIIKNYLKLLSLKPKIVISRATPSAPTYLLKKSFWRWPILYFPYDIRGLCYPNKSIAKKIGLSTLEIYSERFCFENCSGIMHKGDPEELKYLDKCLLGTNIKFAPSISFLPYCSKEFSVPIKKSKTKSKEIHTVYVGAMGADKLNTTNYLFEKSKEIIKQKIHIHVYTKANTLSIEKGFNKMSNHAKKFITSEYFHIHPSLDPKSLIKEISKYDFGIWIYDNISPLNKLSLEPKFATGNKFVSYLEAGIPFLYSKDFEFMDKLMKKYKLDCLGIKDVKDIRKTINKVNYPILLKRVANTRKSLDMDKHFPELESFINRLSQNKKQFPI